MGIFFPVFGHGIGFDLLGRTQKLEIMTARKNDNMRNKGNVNTKRNLKLIREIIVCNRCGGRGELPQYRHVEGGICFKCRGNKSVKMYYK